MAAPKETGRPRSPRRKRSRHWPLLVYPAVVGCAVAAVTAGVLSPNDGSAPAPAPTPPSTNEPVSAPAPPPSGVHPLERSEPRAIDLPSLHIRSSLVPLGLNPDRTVQVPPLDRPMQAGWYRFGATPGERGTFVVLGHVDSHQRAGVFYRLHDLRPGDEVRARRADGVLVHYVVDRVASFDKDQFPTAQVYGSTPRPEIRLITCGGTFDHSTGNYENNVVVFGHMTGPVTPSPMHDGDQPGG